MFSRTVHRSLLIKGFMGQAIIIFIFHMMCKMTGLAVIGARPLGNPWFSHDTDVDILEPSFPNCSVQCAF